MKPPPALLVLAAGMGSRYGGLKQIDPVGPGGETVLDYSVFDALRAGFGRVVFVIRREFEAVFRESVGRKYAGRTEIDYVFQSLDDLPEGWVCPPGREKPWGTGHAVWCARNNVRENFAVINADDFYGADAFAKLSSFLASATSSTYAMAGFRLKDTLSEHGAVSRGVSASQSGRLVSIVEHTGIALGEVGTGKEFSGEEIVSMNCWGFTPAIFAELDSRLRAFLASRGTDPKAEFYLPSAVSDMIVEKRAEVRVLSVSGSWFGITYREDRPRVAASIAELVARGVYPPHLSP